MAVKIEWNEEKDGDVMKLIIGSMDEEDDYYMFNLNQLYILHTVIELMLWYKQMKHYYPKRISESDEGFIEIQENESVKQFIATTI